MRRVFFLLVVMIGVVQGCAPSVPIIRQKVAHFAGSASEGLTYLLYEPAETGGSASAEARWPVILYLHGILENGDDIRLLTRRGIPKHIELGLHLPFFVISPQNSGSIWNIATLRALLDQAIETYPIDEDRIYITGVSLGGFAAWELAASAPDRFAAIAPVSGWGDPDTAAQVRGLPIWAQHGEYDFLVWPSIHEQMIQAVRKAGGQPKWTVVKGGGHDIWDTVYTDAALYKWFLRHKRSPANG